MLMVARQRLGGPARHAIAGLCGWTLTSGVACKPPEPRPPDQSPAALSPYELGPFLLRPDPGRALVALAQPLNEPPSVDYWSTVASGAIARPDAVRVHSVRAETTNGRWVASLTALPPGGGRIMYQVRSSAGNTRPFSFSADADPQGRFRFAVIGGTAGDPAVHRAIVEQVLAEHVDFLLHVGDLVGDAERPWEWDEFFRIEQPLLESVPIFPTFGSHDASSGDQFGRAFLTVLWTDTLHYYCTDWGNLRVVTADAGLECPAGCMEASFVRHALAEGARRGMLLALSVNQPVYSSGSDGSHPGLRQVVGSLAREYGVEIVFSGHDGDYERSKPIDGTTYVTTSGAGMPARPIRPHVFSQVLRTEPHYVIVDVAPDRLTLRALNLRGDGIDSVVLQPLAPRASASRRSGDAEAELGLREEPARGLGSGRWLPPCR
jgi:calcineurin-like phosphoesterase family protein